MATGSRLRRVAGLCGLTWGLATIGQTDAAAARANDTLRAAEAYGAPYWIAFALYGCGLAYAESDPERALQTLKRALRYTGEHRLRNWEALIARDAARMEALHGEAAEGLTLFDTTIAAFHRAGDYDNVSATLASLVVFLNRINHSDVAATIYGSCTRHQIIESVPNLSVAVDELRAALGDSSFTARVDDGAQMETVEAVHYARQHIERIRAERSGPTSAARS